MPHHNTVFHSVLQCLPFTALDDAVQRHQAGACARRFSFKAQLTAMVVAQLSGAASLRHVEHGLRSRHRGPPTSRAARTMPITRDATYVFDLGYYSYAWWAELDAAECRFVTRLKKNTPLVVTQTNPVPQGGPILSNQVGWLPERLAASRRNPWTKPIREVVVRIETGRVLRIATNDLLAPAQEIADLYKRRWAIEMFFRWIKQTLKITRFLGTTQNAVSIQIAIALIAFLLLRIAHQAQSTIESPLAFARLVRMNPMHHRRLDQLHEPPNPRKYQPNNPS